MKIDCTDQNNVEIRSDLEMPMYVLKRDGKLSEKAFDLPISLKFTLNSQGSKDGVTYKKGELSLTIPKELKSYQDGDKSSLMLYKEYFQKFCEKLGFKFEAKIKQNLGKKLKVDSYLESVKPPVHIN